MGWMTYALAIPFALCAALFVTLYINRIVLPERRALQALPELRAGQVWQGRFSRVEILARVGSEIDVEMDLWAGTEVVTVVTKMNLSDLRLHLIYGDHFVLAKRSESHIGQETHA